MAYQGTPSYSGAPASQYSDWIHRVGAYVIDGLPSIAIFIVAYILLIIFSAIHVGFLGVLFFLVGIIASFAWGVYNRWILGGQGQSLGKKQLNMRLLSEETGQPIGTLNAFLRDICHVVDGIICYVGYLFPLWDEKRQTLADKIMKTVVVPA
ncbi:MAG TPA: RDD family protein [Streptosporangiaceae bacterium]|nr:RDD family protein [Streptosporangiaceae bacterium]